MPTLTFPKQELLKYLKQPVEDDTLRDNLSMLGTDIDEWGEEVSVEVFPNRPDLLSVQGLGRALNHYLGFTTELDTYDVQKGSEVVEVLPTAEKVRPYTRCALIRNLDLDDAKIKEIIDIQEKLHVTFGRNRKKVAIGIYPLEHITLPITFGAEKPEDIVFQPLEMNKEVNAKQMLEEHPTGKTYAHLLDEYKLFPVFRDAKGNVLSVPPIINNHTVGKITIDTKEAFMEVSGHDPKPLEEALHMLCCAFIDMGATIESMTVKEPKWEIISPNLSTHTMEIDRTYVTGRAGIPEDALDASLKKMGLSIEKNTVTIPAYRTDFIHQVDVVEEAAIGYGYNNIEPTVPEAYTAGKLDHSYILQEKVRETLSGMGLIEVMNYYITKDGVPLANPLTQEYSSLRYALLPQLLDTLQKNLSHPYPQSFFEIGPVFYEDKNEETRVGETIHIAALQCGEQADYTTIRQALEALCASFEWKVEFAEHTDSRFLPGRCAHITGDVNGVIGEVHPEELAKRGVLFPAAAFEIALHKK